MRRPRHDVGLAAGGVDRAALGHLAPQLVDPHLDAGRVALTLDAARIAGAADRLGSLEKGKIANIVMTEGDLFAEKTTVKVVLIDGRRVDLDATEAPRGRGRGGR